MRQRGCLNGSIANREKEAKGEDYEQVIYLFSIAALRLDLFSRLAGVSEAVPPAIWESTSGKYPKQVAHGAAICTRMECLDPCRKEIAAV
jgi:hypothetical protein